MFSKLENDAMGSPCRGMWTTVLGGVCVDEEDPSALQHVTESFDFGGVGFEG